MHHSLPLLFIMVLVLSACDRTSVRISAMLSDAESLMELQPDSALAILESLNPDTLGPRNLRARYALLLSQAHDKNYIDDISDSIIRIAVDYYRDSPDRHSAMLSFYYMGRVHENAADYGEALYHQM